MNKVPFDDPREHLYIRVTDEQVDPQGHVLDAAVGIPDWSCNRERFSAPDDVLDPTRYPEYTRVAEFTVADVPEHIDPDPAPHGQQQPIRWLFWVEHEPIVDNFAHSEVQMRQDGKPYKRNKRPNSSTYIKKIRGVLADICRVRP